MNARPRLMILLFSQVFIFINNFYFKKIISRFLPWNIKRITMTYKLIDSNAGEGKINQHFSKIKTCKPRLPKIKEISG